MSGDITEPKKKRPYFNFKPWGWDQTFTLLTGFAAIIAAYVALNSEFFKVANERIGNEAVLAKITKERAETDLQKITAEKEQLFKERNQLVADNKVLKDEIQGTNEEWEAIEKASGPEMDFNLGGGYSSNITFYRPLKGFVFYLTNSKGDLSTSPTHDPQIVKFIAPLRYIKRLKKVEIHNYLINTSTMSDIAQCKNITDLELWNTGIDSETISHLETIQNLERLLIYNNPIKSLSGLKKQPSVKDLTLASELLTDDQIKFIPECFPNLERLALPSTKISNESCNQLIKFEKLNWLDISNTEIDKAGLEILMKRATKTFVTIDKSQATPAELDELWKVSTPDFYVNCLGYDWKKKE